MTDRGSGRARAEDGTGLSQAEPQEGLVPSRGGLTVEVIQADRDAAARFYELGIANGGSNEQALKSAEYIRAGGADAWSSVQAFARHRIEATVGLHEACANWIEYLDSGELGSVFEENRLLDAMRAGLASAMSAGTAETASAQSRRDASAVAEGETLNPSDRP